MSSIKEVMKLNINNLAKEQHKALKEHVLGILSKVTAAIKEEKYELIGDFTFSSPAGDGYGLDSDCIDFSYDQEVKDVLEIVRELQSLKITSSSKQ